MSRRRLPKNRVSAAAQTRLIVQDDVAVVMSLRVQQCSSFSKTPTLHFFLSVKFRSRLNNPIIRCTGQALGTLLKSYTAVLRQFPSIYSATNSLPFFMSATETRLI